MKTTIYLLRHAASAPDRKVPEPDWPLSEEGGRQANSLCKELSLLGIERVFSSPFRRAVDTVAPFAEQTGLVVAIEADLRERKLMDGFVEDPAVRLEVLRRSWKEPDFAMPGCESSRICAARVSACLQGIVERTHGQTVVASSHGNAIGLFLNSLDPSFGFEQWREMKNPDLFRIVYDDQEPQWDTSFVYA